MKTLIRLLGIPAMLLALIASLSAQSGAAQSDDPPSRVARLSFVSGNVSFEPSGESQWDQASLNYPLSSGDRLYTDQGGEAEFESGNVAVRLSGSTDVDITDFNDNLIQLGLAQGVLRVRAYNIISGNALEVDTPNAALTLERNGNYRIEAYPDDDSTLVVVNSGELEISGEGIDERLLSGQAARLIGANPVQVARLAPPAYDNFDNWCNDRDRRFLNSVSQQYVGDDVPGYDDLDQYGNWTNAADYGPVWYPAAVPADWAPYRFGRWAWVEPWGWTWVDNEPWGFAPFHYGRWALVGSRWGWIPGERVVRPVYAPALVAFVGGNGLAVAVSGGPPVAWFPLGPREPYFPWYHSSNNYVREVNVTNVRNVTNITNIINVRDVRDIHYVNREVATTAVPANVFRNGEPVGRQMVRVDRTQIARAQVIPHPEVTPEARAVAAGRPKTHPAIEQRRPAIAYRPPIAVRHAPEPMRGGAPENPGTPSEQTRQAQPPNPAVARNVPEAERRNPGEFNQRPVPERGNAQPEPRLPAPANEGRQPEPSNQPGQPAPVQNQRPLGPARNERPLITRSAPPPAVPPFQQRQPAIQQHPGRPLEPQQMQNVRAGRPAGPPRDQEFPPHAQPAPRAAAPARPEPRK